MTSDGECFTACACSSSRSFRRGEDGVMVQAALTCHHRIPLVVIDNIPLLVIDDNLTARRGLAGVGVGVGGKGGG